MKRGFISNVKSVWIVTRVDRSSPFYIRRVWVFLYRETAQSFVTKHNVDFPKSYYDWHYSFVQLRKP